MSLSLYPQTGFTKKRLLGENACMLCYLLPRAELSSSLRVGGQTPVHVAGG